MASNLEIAIKLFAEPGSALEVAMRTIAALMMCWLSFSEAKEIPCVRAKVLLEEWAQLKRELG